MGRAIATPEQERCDADVSDARPYCELPPEGQERARERWREKGWLLLDSNGYNLRYSLGTSRTRLVSIRRAAIMEVNGDVLPLVGHETPLYEALYGKDPWVC